MTILRTCPVIGPQAADTISTVMMNQPVMMRIRGYDPILQFAHEDDLVELLSKVVMERISGVYNVPINGEIKYSEIASLANKQMIVLPDAFIRPLLSLSWKLHLQNQSPAVGLEFIKYPPVVSTEALKKQTGFRFDHTSRESVAAYLGKKFES